MACRHPFPPGRKPYRSTKQRPAGGTRFAPLRGKQGTGASAFRSRESGIASGRVKDLRPPGALLRQEGPVKAINGTRKTLTGGRRTMRFTRISCRSWSIGAGYIRFIKVGRSLKGREPVTRQGTRIPTFMGHGIPCIFDQISFSEVRVFPVEQEKLQELPIAYRACMRVI